MAAGIEVEPDTAPLAFGGRIGLARRYAELLAGAGVERGLIGPREAGRVWSRHLLNCAAVAELVSRDASVVDIGSGAGLPGIPLALARPDVSMVLVEPLLRRSAFLSEAVSELGLARCAVVRARAEDAADRLRAPADVVTARAVASLARLAGWAAPLLRGGGVLLAIKGATAVEELRRGRTAVATCGFDRLELVHAGAELVDPPTVVLRAVRRSA